MDDITTSIIVSCQTSGAVASINKLGFSLAMLGKKAIDFGVQAVSEFRATQDAAWKFSRVFKNLMGTATEAVDEFSSSYNLSKQTAMSMLGDTASILKGAGLSEKAALEMSSKVAKMGVDLASYTGYAGGAAGATEAITSAMLGNTERLKGLGTVIRMDSKEFKDLTKSIAQNKGVSEEQAKMMATLELVYKKNKDAVGDYMAEGENFTQNINIWNEAVKQFTSNVGGLVYEVLGLNDAVGGVGEKLKSLNAWWEKEGKEMTFAIRSVFIDISSGVELIGAGLKAGLQTFQAFFTSLTKMFTSFSVNWKADWMSMAKIAANALSNPVLALKDLSVMVWKSVDFKGINFSADFNRILDENKKAHEAALKRYIEGLKRPQDNKEQPQAVAAPIIAISEAQKNALSSLASAMNQYRATTQGAIFSNSLESMRMRSRRMVGTAANPAETTAKNSEKQVELNKEMVDKLSSVVDKLSSLVTSGIKLSNVAVKTY